MANKKLNADAAVLARKHTDLIQSNDQKVVSHTQREVDDWFLHTVMIEGANVPFKFKRKDRYQSLTGARINLTYYPAHEMVAGLRFEVMNVVRIKRA